MGLKTNAGILVAGIILGALLTKAAPAWLASTSDLNDDPRSASPSPESHEGQATAAPQLPAVDRTRWQVAEAPAKPEASEVSDSGRGRVDWMKEPERSRRLKTDFGTLDDVIADLDLNPGRRSLDQAQRSSLNEVLLALQRNRSMAELSLSDLQQQAMRSKIELGLYEAHKDRVAPRGPGGSKRFFTQSPDGSPIVVDILPGDHPMVDHAREKLDRLIEEGREELRQIISAL